MKILFSGGGTLGSVTPLLAIREALSHEFSGVEYIWVGTKDGPERAFIQPEKLRYIPLPAGKLRRYISFQNLVDLFRMIHAFFSSLLLLRRERPNLCVSVGGFVSVPLHWAAWCLRIPTWIHQQDAKPGLANRLMAPCARVITTALRSNEKEFPPHKTKFLGNPVRSSISQGDKEKGAKIFHLTSNLPVVLVLGGGTGAARVNELIVEALPFLAEHCDVIHVYGKDRLSEDVLIAEKKYTHYHAFSFLEREMTHAYAVADLVVGRAGLGTLTELAALSKPVILLPKHGHQEDNARALQHADAAVVLDESQTNGQALSRHIRTLLHDDQGREKLGRHLHEYIHISTPSEIRDVVQAVVT